MVSKKKKKIIVRFESKFKNPKPVLEPKLDDNFKTNTGRDRFINIFKPDLIYGKRNNFRHCKVKFNFYFSYEDFNHNKYHYKYIISLYHLCNF